MSRARRRSDLDRVKKRAKRIFWWATPTWAIKLANNLASCSRYCCGNRRKYDGPTRKEIQKDGE